jgi:hypothetical protein
MVRLIQYEDLDRHFHVPKSFLKQRGHYMFSRLPRKLKKKIKKKGYRDWHDINVKMWLLMQEENINYHRFLIKKICEHCN